MLALPLLLLVGAAAVADDGSCMQRVAFLESEVADDRQQIADLRRDMAALLRAFPTSKQLPAGDTDASVRALSEEVAQAGPTMVDRLDVLETDAYNEKFASENTWILLTATIVFLMQYGFALLESGMCRKNNTTATYAKNMVDAMLGTVVCVLFGYQLSYHVSPLTCSIDLRDDVSRDDVHSATSVCAGFFHHLVFQATAATIVSGAMAERTTVMSYAALSTFISGVPFSLAVRWTWGGGWLDGMGFHDFAGGTVVHVVGGAAALAGVLVVGPRDGRYDPHRFYEFMPNDVASVMSGSLILWVGWYGFNMGSVADLGSVESAYAAANSAVTTTVAAAMGGLTAITFAWMRSLAIGGRSHSLDAISLSNGLLSGLVAITPASDVASIMDSAWIGIGSAGAYMLASAMSEALYLDDVVEAGAVHAGCGAWGTVACGLFHPTKGLFYTFKWKFLAIQTLGTVVIGAVAFIMTWFAAKALQYIGVLRVDPEDEAKGLNHKFGIAASSFHYDRAQRIRQCAQVLEHSGGTIKMLLEALHAVKEHILLPFNPQASDIVLEGQITDILSRMDISFAMASAADSGAERVSFKPNPLEHLDSLPPSPPSAEQDEIPTPKASKEPLMRHIASAFSGKSSAKRDQTREKDKVSDSSVRGMFAESSTKASSKLDVLSDPSTRGSRKLERALSHAFTVQGGLPGQEGQGEEAAGATGGASSIMSAADATSGRSEDGPIEGGPKWLAFLSHHKKDGGDAARVFVDTARRVFSASDEDGAGGTLSKVASKVNKELIFLDSSNLSDLSQLLNHVEESANYILMLTRSTLERPWVLAELVRAHQCGKRILVISASWPGDESSPQGRSFKLAHLDEAIDEWQEFYYESTLRMRAMTQSSERSGPLAKMIAGSLFFQRVKENLKSWLHQTNTQRPANASTWMPEKWDSALRVGVTRSIYGNRRPSVKIMDPARFKASLVDPKAGGFQKLVDQPLAPDEA